jgi:hypothetical protein
MTISTVSLRASTALACTWLLAAAAGSSAAASSVVEPTAVEAATPIARVSPALSYIRFANMAESGTATHSVEVYGLDSHSVLGTVQVDVPAKGSLQVRPTDMIRSLQPIELNQFVALYVRGTGPRQFWQHVKFDPRSGAFSDAGVCTKATPAADEAPVALNVHTAAIPTYVSFVTVHNFTDIGARYQARVYNAATGAALGAATIELGPRGTFSENGLWFHNAVGLFFPGADLPHLNVEFVELGGPTGARLSVAHEVVNALTGETANLSNPCVL